jgi:CubicO group peptidase (beta-lactamase class C family)
MSLGLSIRAIFFLILVFAAREAAALSPSALPRSNPEAQGVSSAGVRAFVEAADQQVDTMHSFMLVRHGHVVAEGWWAPESADKPHILWSLSKSFTSTAVGLAVSEGKLGIDDKVLSFFPEDAPADPSDNLKAMRVRDLLTMSTGHAAEPWASGDEVWTKRFLAQPVPHRPGSTFLYNTPATYMQSAIVQKVTGQTVLDFLTPRLFEPLGIEKPTWDQSPQGISLGGYGLYLRTEDIAKFGQLLLQKGQWNGKQIIPAEWIAQATSKQVDNDKAPSAGNPDWRQGYGFQFWHVPPRSVSRRRQGRSVLYRVFRNRMRSSPSRRKREICSGNSILVWEYLLPAFHDGAALPRMPLKPKELQTTLSSLSARRTVSSKRPLTLVPPTTSGPCAERTERFRAFPVWRSRPAVGYGQIWYAGVTPSEDHNNYVVVSTSGDEGKILA